MPANQTKRCHYEVLSVTQDCSENELKKAYKAAALKFHPDKNQGREAEAEEEFKLVKEAYDILSDPHERSWYDSHRTQILRGQQPGADDDEEGGGMAAATEVDLFSYFSNSCFDSYDDEEDGFYTVYRELFLVLAAEEKAAGARNEWAEFGRSDSNWSVVKAFYDRWVGFNSSKTFGHADKWNLAEAENREIRRAMDKENKKERTKAKREFNDLVRKLAEFVKKRDPRVKKQKKVEEKLKAEREEQKRIKAELDAERRRQRNKEMKLARDQAMEEDAAGLDEILADIALDDKREKRKAKKKKKQAAAAAAAAAGDDDAELQEDDLDNEDEDLDDEEEEEEVPENFYCMACKKTFRTNAQLENHYKSKKCKQAWNKLRRQIVKEDAMFFDARSS